MSRLLCGLRVQGWSCSQADGLLVQWAVRAASVGGKKEARIIQHDGSLMGILVRQWLDDSQTYGSRSMRRRVGITGKYTSEHVLCRKDIRAFNS